MLEFPAPRIIFISYSRAHDRKCVRELYETLHSFLEVRGCKVWLDEEEILGGQLWEEEIGTTIAKSHVVLVCLSKQMLASRGYVHRELQQALVVQQEMPAGRIYVIPVRLDECDVPSPLRKFHWVNWFEDFGKRLLLKTLEHALEDKPPPVWVWVKFCLTAMSRVTSPPHGMAGVGGMSLSLRHRSCAY
jgi:hypothetical protein